MPCEIEQRENRAPKWFIVILASDFPFVHIYEQKTLTSISHTPSRLNKKQNKF